GFTAAALAAAITIGSVSPPQHAMPSKPVAAVQMIAASAPLRAAALLDGTASRDEARISASLDDLTPLFDRLRVSGGEIGFGRITDDSDLPLIRCYVPEPPEPPTFPPPPSGNVFANANLRKREDTERKKYEAKRRAWEADANARIDAFIAAITPILTAPPTAPRTDIVAAIARGDLMIAEPSPFRRPAQTAIVIITDGYHNATTASTLTLRSNTQVVIVNGIGSLGILEKLTPRPLRFESTAAAVRYITLNGDTNAR
ncbi:MAG TPA: hypothetical protein VF698_18550, partial [Thermoanaerobaculia bacterium]